MASAVILTLIALCGSSLLVSGDGSVELDEFSFDKVISKFPASLVKFDVAFPYGDKHDAYTSLARESSGVDDLLIAEVGVKDYGEKENEALAKKYGASKENFPVVKLFLQGKSEPVAFESSTFSTDELRKFVRAHSGIYLSLPGCVAQLDELAIKFTAAPTDQRQSILAELEKALKNLNEKEAPSGKIYKLIMQRVIEKGDSFLASELERVNKLLTGKITDAKKRELNTRLNIIQTFQLKSVRDEL